MVSNKKCVPGVICFENMTLFLFFVIGMSVVYLYYIQFSPSQGKGYIHVQSPPPPPIRYDPALVFDPPLKTLDMRGGIPVNIETSSYNTSYQQVGILTKHGAREPTILALMGRYYGRDKWQYYTVSSTPGLFNRLPIRVNGKNCTGEYGCEGLSTGDTAYVEGYDETFRVTIYENARMNYIPY